MKFVFFILIISCMFLPHLSNAQASTNKNSQTTVTKGYYSIGRNAEKLKSGAKVKTIWSPALSSVQKGYYSITFNRQKHLGVYKLDRSGTIPTPVRKGYYGIKGQPLKIELDEVK